MAELQQGRPEPAWDLFLARYRRIVFAAIRHYAQDYDDVMDVFARVCEALREDDLRRLRAWVDQPKHSARFSTWLVTVVRNLTIDWFRHRDGRRRLSAVAEGLPPLRRRIFEHVFLDRRRHVEAYELIRAGELPDLSFRAFLAELRATYRAVTGGRRGALLRDGAAGLVGGNDVMRLLRYRVLAPCGSALDGPWCGWSGQEKTCTKGQVKPGSTSSPSRESISPRIERLPSRR